MKEFINSCIIKGLSPIAVMLESSTAIETSEKFSLVANLDFFVSLGAIFVRIQQDGSLKSLQQAYAIATTFNKLSELWGDPAGFKMAKAAKDKFIINLDMYLEHKFSYNSDYPDIELLEKLISQDVGHIQFADDIKHLHQKRFYVYRVDIDRDFQKIKDSCYRAKRWDNDKMRYPHRKLIGMLPLLGPTEAIFRICFLEDETSLMNVNDTDAMALARKYSSPQSTNRLIRIPRQEILDLGFSEDCDYEYSNPKIKARLFAIIENVSNNDKEYSSACLPFDKCDILIDGDWINLQRWVESREPKDDNNDINHLGDGSTQSKTWVDRCLDFFQK